jgi:7-cyano-7-deazaguanine synthase in queuosine biosynthesis
MMCDLENAKLGGCYACGMREIAFEEFGRAQDSAQRD